MSSGAPVVIDGRAAVRREIGGVERVARELATRLPRLRSDRYRVERPPAALAHRAGHLWEQLALPVLARRAERILCPANLAPLASRKNVVVIHDVAPLRHPEWYSATYARYQARLLPALARRARAVLTVSEFAREEIVGMLGVDPIVIPNGVSEQFSSDADPGPARAAFGLERQYVLAVGTPSERKNLGALAAAERALADAGIDLVTAGSGRGHLSAGPASPGRALRYVPDDLLPGLYRGALALVMPSLYEGFGLPCLEAMACGTPVVASNRAALPETCGEAALLVDPQAQDEIADAVLTAATEASARSQLIAAGHARAGQFSWSRSAESVDAAVSGSSQ